MFLKDSALNRLKEAKVYTFVGRLGKRLLLSCRDRRRGSFQGVQEAASTGREGVGRAVGADGRRRWRFSV